MISLHITAIHNICTGSTDKDTGNTHIDADLF